MCVCVCVCDLDSAILVARIGKTRAFQSARVAIEIKIREPNLQTSKCLNIFQFEVKHEYHSKLIRLELGIHGMINK